MTPEQVAAGNIAVTYWHEVVWDATVGLIEATQVHAGANLTVPRWADLDETRRSAFVSLGGQSTEAIVMLVGYIGSTPPEQDTPFGKLIIPPR